MPTVTRFKNRPSRVIRKRHDGEEDVTVISQDSMLAAFDNILATLTMAIAAISSISLLVAGILIMNISSDFGESAAQRDRLIKGYWCQ